MRIFIRILTLSLLQPGDDSNERYTRAFLIAILLMAIAVRAIGLGNESLWSDEIISVQRSQLGLPDLLTDTQGHQPLYFILLYEWINLFGSSELVLRIPSLIFGVLTVVAIYALATQFTGKWCALLAALLVAISPVMIWYSQEVRMYAMTSFLFVYCVHFAFKYMSRPRFRYIVLYGIGASLGAFTHFYFIYFIVAINIVVLPLLLMRRNWREVIKWSSAHVLVILPVVYRLADVLVEVGSQFEGTGTGYTEPALKVMAQFVRLVGFEDFKLGGPTFLVILAIATIGLSIWAAMARGDRIQLLLPILVIPAFLLLLGAVFLNLPIVVRYLVPVVPLWYLFPAYGFGLAMSAYPRRRFLAYGIVVSLVAVFIGWSGFIWYQQLRIPTKQQWREMAAMMKSEPTAEDTLFVVPDYHFRHLDYYLNGADVAIGHSVSDYPCLDRQQAAWVLGKEDLMGETVQSLAIRCGLVESKIFAGQLIAYKFANEGMAIRCNGIAPTMIGTPDSDVINGTAADDVIHGLGGDDIINGLEGDDIICGGDGNDTLNGGLGDDQLFGENGDDVLSGGSGVNRQDGGLGNDTIN